MTIHPTRFTRNSIAMLTAAILFAVGCGKGSSDQKKLDSSAKKIDSGLMNQLKQTGTVGDYQLSLPEDYTFVEDPKSATRKFKMATWKGRVKEGDIPSLLSLAILTDSRTVNEAGKNMRQMLVNFSAGMTDGAGIQITKREQTETGNWGSMQYSRFLWSGSLADGTVVKGMAYGAIDNGQVVAVIGENFGTNADSANQLLEAAISTLKKK